MKIKLLFPAMVLAIAGLTLKAQPVKEHGMLSVNGIQLTDEHGEDIVLHGVSFGWHNWWPRFYNEETVSWLANDWGCTVVRAAMGIAVKNDYISRPSWTLKKMEAVIDAAIENDIYVIIDWHSHKLLTEEAMEFFKMMAKKYGDNPHIIYEIFNEPVRDSWKDVKDYSIAVIKTIREYDPDNIILVGSPHWDQDLHIVADDPIEGFSNIMYTLHFYAATHGKELRDRGDYAMKKGIPIFVSESAGMSANGDGPLDYESWNIWIDWMKENKISWVTWSIADKDETCSMLLPKAGSKGNWAMEDLKESGVKTREMYRKLSGLDD